MSRKLGDSSKAILTCNTEMNYPFWAKKPACAPYQPPIAILSRPTLNPATSPTSSLTSILNYKNSMFFKSLKAYPDPDPHAVAPIDANASDVAVQRNRFDQEIPRRGELIRSAQETRSIQIRRQFIRNMSGWLCAKLLE